MQLMENKKFYNFQVYAPSVLGSDFRNIEILGYLPYETAVMLNGELAPVHAEVFSTGRLPNGTPNDPRQYNYYRIRKPNGTTTTIGEVWIDSSTIEVVDNATAYITIPNASNSDLRNLQTALRQAGYADFQIRFE